MPSRTLEDHYEEFKKVFNAGDRDGLLALYAEDCVMVPEPGITVQGAALHDALDGFLALKGTMDLKLRGTVEGPSVAITYGAWTVEGTGPDGTAVTLAGESTEVVAKQPDGTWRIVLDDPWSCAG